MFAGYLTSDIIFQSSALPIYTLMCVWMVGRLQVFFYNQIN